MRKLTRKIKIRKFIEKYGFILTSINQLELKKQYLLIEQPNCDLVAKEVKSFMHFEYATYVPERISDEIDLYPTLRIQAMLGNAKLYYYRNGVKYRPEEYRNIDEDYRKKVCESKAKEELAKYPYAEEWVVIYDESFDQMEWFALHSEECLDLLNHTFDSYEAEMKFFTKEEKEQFISYYAQYILNTYIMDSRIRCISFDDWIYLKSYNSIKSFV